MTFSIPDSFSTQELERMLEDALPEPEVSTDPANQSPEYISEIADEAIQLATSKSAGPLVHKIMLINIVDTMIQWHTAMAQNLIEEGHTTSAIAWLRDAGKFQAIANILSTVSVDTDDFTCTAK